MPFSQKTPQSDSDFESDKVEGVASELSGSQIFEDDLDFAGNEEQASKFFMSNPYSSVLN